MVHVGTMTVRVRERVVAMCVRVGFPRRLPGSMPVLVVLVVDVSVLVLELRMVVHVSVLRAHQRDDTGNQDERGDEIPRREAISEDGHGRERSREWRHGEERGFACCSEQAHRVDGEHEAEPVAHESDEERRSENLPRESFLREESKDEGDGARAQSLHAGDGDRVS